MDDLAWVRNVRGSRDSRGAQQRMARAIHVRPTAALDIAQALSEDLDRDGYDIAVDALRRNAFVLTCQVPGADATRVAVELGARPRLQPTPSARPDYVRPRNAQEIVGRRPPDEVRDVLSADLLRHDDPEFGLLLVHELVLRAGDVGPVASWYAGWAERAAHPLAPLPLSLLDVEAGLGACLPQYGAGNRSSWTGLPDLPARRRLGDLVPGVGVPAPVPTDLVAAPFQDWLDNSNGSVQVARYVLGDAFPADVPDLDLRPDREAARVPPARVVQSLFGAASNGGAYSPSPGGALARLRFWTSLRALLGLPADLPVDEVAHAAAKATWIQLATDDDWFYNVAWDVWLVVTDGASVTMVAATDTD